MNCRDVLNTANGDLRELSWDYSMSVGDMLQVRRMVEHGQCGIAPARKHATPGNRMDALLMRPSRKKLSVVPAE